MATEIDDKLLRKINRQLRGIKLLLGFFSLLIICMFIVLGFIAYRVVSFTHDVEQKVTNIQNTTQQKLDLKSQLCDGTTSNIVTEQVCN